MTAVPVHLASVSSPAVSPALIARELGRLPPSQVLLDDGRFAVVTFRAQQAPSLMSEVERLRELGGWPEPVKVEPSCIQLIAVDRNTGSVIGGYRMGAREQLGQRFLAPQWTRSQRGLPLLELGLQRWLRKSA
jgi:hypothetical protein